MPVSIGFFLTRRYFIQGLLAIARLMGLQQSRCELGDSLRPESLLQVIKFSGRTFKLVAP